MDIKQTNLWRFISSVKVAIWLITLITLFSLLGTLIPQNQDPVFYIAKFGDSGYQALRHIGLSNVYSSWYFILLLVLFSLNLTTCLLNSLPLRNRTLGSFISHTSILVILLGALIGMFYGQRGNLVINKGEEASSFIDKNKQINLGFSIRLDDFIYTENIDPKEKLLVYSVKNSEDLVAQIPTKIGTASQISNTGYTIKILRYLPDFTMNVSTKEIISRSSAPDNPAIEVELRDKAGTAKKFWVFSRFPDMHKEIETDFKFVYNWVMRRPKDFISKVTIFKNGKEVISKDIRVNDPLSFFGYTFFQSTYDSQALNWSGLKIVKDPGVPVIYLGFIMLMLGLALIFYIRPLIRRYAA